MLYGRTLNNIFKTKMEEIHAFEEDINRRLAHAIKDLEDVRVAMAALESVRAQQIEIDMMLTPIEVSRSPSSRYIISQVGLCRRKPTPSWARWRST